ncbi:hypothetical protein ACSBR2_013265 [Camellia fascicularis]
MTTGERERERESQQSFLLHNIFIFVASSFPTIVCKKCSFFLEESATKALVSSQGMEHESKIQVPRVKLGAQGLEVSRLGFGCGGLSGILNAPLSHEAGCSILKEAFHKGITFFDTADVCGQKHDNEIMIGKALKQLPREQVQLATKCGIISVDWTHVEVKGTPDYVQQCCEASLKRLDVDYIDLFYTHRVDLSLPIEDTIGELKKLVEEGKIKYIGLSEASVDLCYMDSGTSVRCGCVSKRQTFINLNLRILGYVSKIGYGYGDTSYAHIYCISYNILG